MPGRIMIIDDDADFRAELGETLKLNGFEVALAGDADKALDAVAEYGPDCILLDLKFKLHSGLDVAVKLKNTASFSKIPVIIMTGFYEVNSDTLREYFGTGRFLKKPFSQAELVEKINSALGK